MTEEMYLKVLTGAIGVITTLATVVAAMLAWYLKGLKAELTEVKRIQDNIGNQHIQITTNYLTRFTNLEHTMVTSFEELRGVLNDHFETRHTAVVEEITGLQKQITENVRRNNDNSTDFFKKYAPVLAWAEGQYEQHNRRGRNVHKKPTSD